MRKLSADQVFTGSSPPIERGVVVIDSDGEILDVLPSRSGLEGVEVFDGLICPGFVNAHCHLELSYLKGKIPEGGGLHSFIRNIESIRGSFSSEERAEAIVQAEQEMIKNGIVAVGDIVNGRSTFSLKERSSLLFYNFIEVFAFDPNKAEEVFQRGKELYELCPGRKSITPHAPYSASEPLLELIAGHTAEHNELLSFHNRESEGENLMFQEGRGEILNILGTWNDISWWKPTAYSSTDYILKRLPENNKKLLVHNTFLPKEELEEGNETFCFCPNANRYIEGCLPAMDWFIEHECKITLGTDSYASNWSLSILDEMKAVQRYAPHISVETLLEWATKNGAEFFGFGHLGTIEKGKRPGLNLIENIKEGKLAEAVIRKLV